MTNTPLQPATPTIARLSDDSPDAARYRAILQRKIDEGAQHAANVITTIERDQPRDQIVRARAAGFDVAPTSGIRVRVADDWYQPTDFALGQIAGRAGVPLQYLRELAAPQSASWQHQLASEILGQHYGNAGDVRVLVRSVRGQLRGWVSDKYRRLDSRPLVDALANEARSAGAIPIDGGIAWVSLNRAFDYLAELRREFPAVAVFSAHPDQDQIGRIQAAQVRILVPNGGEVAYVRGPLRTVSANARDTSFRSALAGAATHVTPLSADWSVEGGRQAAKTWLSLAGRPKPEHCAVVAQNDSMAYGARLALRENQSPGLGKIPVLGCNGAPEFGRRMVNDRTLAATVIVPSPARCAVDTLAAVLAGAPPPSADISIAVSSFPELSALASAGRKAR